MDGPAQMDDPVPRNKQEEVQKPMSQRQLAQMAQFKEKVRMMIRDQVEQQHTATRKRMGLLEEEEEEEEVIRTKKPRQNFKLNMPTSVLTARDLVRLIPMNEGGFTIIYNPERGTFGFKKKISAPKRVETVAKARDQSFGHTLIFSTKFGTATDIEGMAGYWDERQRVFQQ